MVNPLGGNLPKEERLIGWLLPAVDWIALNVDGASNRSLHKSAAGGALKIGKVAGKEASHFNWDQHRGCLQRLTFKLIIRYLSKL